jgi:predicted DCC family thiol-disulfide oxidoreductase YuxK
MRKASKASNTSRALIEMVFHNHIVLFDGVCNLCNGLVRFIIRKDRNAKIKFAPFQSSEGRSILQKSGLNPTDFDTVIYFTVNMCFQRSTAVLRILKDLGGGWSLFYVFIIIPVSIRDFFYNLIARNRYKIFGKTDSCMVPSPEISDRFLI